MIKFLVSLQQYMMTITFRNHEFSPGYFQDKEKKMKIGLTCMHVWIIKWKPIWYATWLDWKNWYKAYYTVLVMIKPGPDIDGQVTFLNFQVIVYMYKKWMQKKSYRYFLLINWCRKCLLCLNKSGAGFPVWIELVGQEGLNILRLTVRPVQLDQILCNQ